MKTLRATLPKALGQGRTEKERERVWWGERREGWLADQWSKKGSSGETVEVDFLAGRTLQSPERGCIFLSAMRNHWWNLCRMEYDLHLLKTSNRADKLAHWVKVLAENVTARVLPPGPTQ